VSVGQLAASRPAVVEREFEAVAGD